MEFYDFKARRRLGESPCERMIDFMLAGVVEWFLFVWCSMKTEKFGIGVGLNDDDDFCKCTS